MGQCWWCYWGWPKPVREIYDEAVKRLGGIPAALHLGPGHLVWGDENFYCAQWSLDNFTAYEDPSRLDEHETEVIRWSLERLVEIPEEFLRPPGGYDGENPEDFRPPAHWEMTCR